MRCQVVFWLMVVWIACAPSVTRAAAPSAKAAEFFEARVRPVLVEHCQKCHGASKQESGLRLDSREAMLRGGNSGPAVVVGKPEESLLMDAVRREGLEMPPDDELIADEIAALEAWIRGGAVWPAGAASTEVTLGDQTRLFAEAKSHWAFQPVGKPPLPKVKNAAWVQSPVDAFILARLEAEGMQPSPPADRRTLLRRLSFDLAGLPPTEEEVIEFERDRSPEAVARVVDRLLASPRYGERWGRHWLDVARYADTRDFIAAGADRRYPFAYTYRDWVIAAFNRDLPYNEFIKQQLAADLLATDKTSPDLAALGLLTVGPRYQNNVAEQIADRVDVVGRGFLGLAVTCARCHDHKYDPIPTADYYGLYGVFASCEEPQEMPLLAGMTPPAELLADYEKMRGEKQADLDRYALDLREQAYADLRSRMPEYLLGYYEISVAKTESIRSLITTRKLKEIAMTPLANNLDRLRREAKWQGDPVVGPLFHQLLVNDANFAGHLQRKLKSGQTGEKSPQAINPVVLVALRENPPKDKRAVLELYGKLFDEAYKKGATGEPGASATGAKPAGGSQKSEVGSQKLPDADWEQVRQKLVAEDGPFGFTTAAVVAASRLLGAGRTTLAKFENAIKDIESTHPGAPARAFALVDKPTPVEPVVFLRGDPSRRGDRVPRKFLSVLAPNGLPFKQGSGRRELAEAIADASNPLTPRVLVNRVWLHHFGEGLVNTPGDFGFRSNPPSHPELLDWLAAEFLENGWSIKKLHRLLVLSSAYQQSSQPNSEATAAYAAKDPENRLWWRANRRRLDFEAMRDAMLAVSGRLDSSVGGRPVSLTESPFTTRRTVYGFVDRLNLDPIFSTFDFASPEVSTSERAETTVPQQALFGMNHPFVIEQARALVGSDAFKASSDDAARLQQLYGRVFARQPAPAEIDLASRFMAASNKQRRDAEQASTAVWQYGYGSSDPQASAEDRFHSLPLFTGESYQASAAYPDPKLGHVRLSKNGGHPGRTQETAIVRRWTAPNEMTVDISGTLNHLTDRGDGIRAKIVAADGRVLGQWQIKNEKVETAASKVAVKRGETIDFVVDCFKTASADAFSWSSALRAVGEMKMAAKGDKSADMWDARADFAPPPPPPLTAWEQLAQALLLTNEFLFVD